MGDPDSASLDLGIDIQEMVAQRLATKNKKTVQLSELLRDTKFTKDEIRTMYRGFKQVGGKLLPWYKSYTLYTIYIPSYCSMISKNVQDAVQISKVTSN